MLAQPPRECGGCAAKASPQLVAELVEQVRQADGHDVIVGLAVPDDAAVHRVDEQTAVVTTVDVSPPLSEDPYVSGAIAAANAVNDIYAMGAQVLSALIVAAFPRGTDNHLIAQMMSGAQDVVSRCGAAVTGGHTVHSTGRLFGLSVTGLVHPDRVWRVSGAQPGDLLVLSKPLGVGLAVTSLDPSVLPEALELMQQPVREAADALSGIAKGPHAVTDVTGYGLLGHLLDMVTPEISMHVFTDRIPLVPGAMALAENGWRTSGHASNLDWISGRTHTSVSDAWMALLVDPQTSGGLLAAIPPGPIPQGFSHIGTVQPRTSGDDYAVCISTSEG